LRVIRAHEGPTVGRVWEKAQQRKERKEKKKRHGGGRQSGVDDVDGVSSV
jgi:hypothetical protein